MYTIEKGIPIPEITLNSKYPYRLMEVGDSFFAELPMKTISPAASYFGKRHNMKFTCRREKNGIRVFRIK